MPIRLDDNGFGKKLPVFLCEACKRPAGFGFDCFPSAERAGFENGRWYCASIDGRPACSVSGVAVLVPQASLEPLPPAFPEQRRLL